MSVQILIIDQFEMLKGCSEARLRLIDHSGSTEAYSMEEINPYDDPAREAHYKALRWYIGSYGVIRPLYAALSDGWEPFQTEEVPVHRSWWTGKPTDGSPEHAYACRRWYLRRPESHWRVISGRP